MEISENLYIIGKGLLEHVKHIDLERFLVYKHKILSLFITGITEVTGIKTQLNYNSPFSMFNKLMFSFSELSIIGTNTPTN